LAAAGAAAASAEAAAKATWQQQVVLAVELLNSLPVSPAAADAAALLKACAALQTLLGTAEDQQYLQDWLAAPAAAASKLGTEQLAPEGSNDDMRSLVVDGLVRLVDCPKPDVVIKVSEDALILLFLLHHVLQCVVGV
jgi:hypothetical protein